MSELDRHREVTLLELVDRVVHKGVVLSGDITIAVADVDLIKLELRALLASAAALERRQGGDSPGS